MSAHPQVREHAPLVLARADQVSGGNPNAARHLFGPIPPLTGAVPEMTTLVTIATEYTSPASLSPHPQHGKNDRSPVVAFVLETPRIAR